VPVVALRILLYGLAVLHRCRREIAEGFVAVSEMHMEVGVVGCETDRLPIVLQSGFDLPILTA